MSAQGWFQVDKGGLAKLIERRGTHWILAELLQNAWDAPGVTRVDLTLTPIAGVAAAQLRIEDDSPEGFVDLAHAFTLFAESTKKADPGLRGRFNLGEKLVLALCEEACVSTTTGTVRFDAEGRHEHPRKRRDEGTVFEARARLTRTEIDQALASARNYLAPAGITTTLNGRPLIARTPLASAEVSLHTEIADAEGILRRRRRTATIAIHAPHAEFGAWLYELGIPIMPLAEDTWSVDVGQKVPLALERDSVSPAYLRDVRVAVLNTMASSLPEDAAAGHWVGDALASRDVSTDAVRAVVGRRFGERAVAFDPSDLEANHRAVAADYALVSGGAFNAAQWTQIRRAHALPAAGRVTPTPRPFDPHGAPARHVTPTPAMQRFADWLVDIGPRLIGRPVRVAFLADFNATASYGHGLVCFNVRRLGKRWFEGPLCERQISLVLHELAHEIEGNHLSERYYEACTDLGARLTVLALSSPDMVRLPEAPFADHLASGPGRRDPSVVEALP